MSVTGLGLREKAKGGWHPKGKDGKKESWRGDFKGVNQISGWMGKGKDGKEGDEHVSRPLSTLKDPSEFGPPPKHVNYYGAGAQGTPRSEGLGAPLSREYINETQAQKEAERKAEEEEAAKPKPPPMPYRVDTTGLSTANLPPPPGRKDREDSRTPPQADKRKPPGLPPRLPPRQDSYPSSSSPSPSYGTSTAPPDSHKGILNQGSLNRLGAAGISVPGFGVGESKSKPTLPPPSASSLSHASPPPPQGNSSPINDLQSRFSRLSPTSPKPESPSEGTSFAQKKAAMKTATDFRNDPSSVSLKDARAAASTANNFRERHGDQVASGWQSANKLNNKYGVADKLGGLSGTRTAPAPPPGLPQAQEQENITGAHGVNRPPDMAGLARKKPPPPPPMKKPGLAGSAVSKEPRPPPIPLSSKPKPPVSGYQ
ncbi:uncharacterized protein BP5553_00554 [Venustampulla echinocandica]|uniref:Uncharacterized protein n=1 Tax=Venustampulla echinocandica TaxID=2656787 RepID=A0A370TYH1_9HELO|nr:uncharacterized protein BP5553_00554 [Venustampulla echinocandica]RDL40575.1 hypothetical protein BP5553_00554 [Venustampulla echinocandica]